LKKERIFISVFFVVTAAILISPQTRTLADDWQPAMPLLATADTSVGEQQSRMCGSCHSFDKNGSAKIGPNLYSIINKSIAGAAGYDYSDALKAKKGEKWTYDALDHYLYSPKAYAPGTKMTFTGIKDAQKRADLIAWLRAQSDKPALLPKSK
jgi:cytochrome c